MVQPFLSGANGYLWIVATRRANVAGFAYCAPEALTDGTFNLLALAVDPAVQRNGIAAALVRALELQLRERHARLLLVETSSLGAYAGARAFYERVGFRREARIREFYAAGEDKLVFRKPLGVTRPVSTRW